MIVITEVRERNGQEVLSDWIPYELGVKDHSLLESKRQEIADELEVPSVDLTYTIIDETNTEIEIED